MQNFEETIFSIILAGGKSSRMRSPDKAKVCFPVSGKPAIVALLDRLHAEGIRKHIVVVGFHADQVMQTVSQKYPQVIYAYQPIPLGTGNAAKFGASVLRQLSFSGPVLVIAGDKYLQPGVISRLIARFDEQNADLAFVIGEKDWDPTAGRIVYSLEGEPIANVEKYDSGRSRLLAAYFAHTERGAAMESERALAFAREFIGPDEKIALALGELYDLLRKGSPLTRNLLQRFFSPEDRLIRVAKDRQITGAEVEKSKYVNLSVYLFKSEALYSVLQNLNSNNVQKEEYLTDVISILAQQKRQLVPVKANAPEEVMGFNTPEELQKIEECIAPAKSEPQREVISGESHRRVSEWLKLLSHNGRIEKWFGQFLGFNKMQRQKNLELLKHCLLQFKERYGDEPVVIARAPGRVNLMGRHIDHQGGPCNTLAINREIFLIARPRQDRLIRLCNLQSQHYPNREFSLNEFDAFIHQQNWSDFLQLSFVQRALNSTRGDWSHYIRGTLLRLQKQFPGQPLKGMDILVGGNIPAASGLSSSSALVVAIAEAAARLNALAVTRQELVELCSEAEWFVGTRGGGSDHAAILFSEPGKINLMEFYPFRTCFNLAWPKDLFLLICNSGIKAGKNAKAQIIFNQRIACYKIAVNWFKKKFPELAENFHLIRDLHPAQLHFSLAKFYQLLLEMPERLGGDEIRHEFSDVWQEFFGDALKATNSLFPVRDVLIYGLAEIERSRQFAKHFKEENFQEIGRLMRISHNGDRVSISQANGTRAPFRIHYDDNRLRELAQKAMEGLQDAALFAQPGSYACSTPEIDLMVDLAQAIEGVIGAQIAGAGLGGSVMVLLKRSAIKPCVQKLNEGYYVPLKFEPRMFLSYPVEKGGILEMPA